MKRVPDDGGRDQGQARRWIRVRPFGEGGSVGASESLTRDPSGTRTVREGSEDRLPPVVLLHGFTGSAESWGSDLLQSLAGDRTVLAVDLPGHGSGAEIPDPLQCTVEDVVAGICAVLDELRIPRADFVGYSMGGRIALATAVLRPDRIRRMVLESASPGIEDDAARDERRRGDEDLAQAIEDRGIEWFVDYWMGLPLFESQGKLPLALLRDARARRRRSNPEALAAALRGMGTGVQQSYWGALVEVRVPTLILTGELDRKYEAIGAQMAGRLPDCRHRRVQGAGHNLHFEAPERWLKLVEEFLAT